LTAQELAELRDKAHKSFDRIWQEGRMSRTFAYRWLARRLGMTRKQAHMSRMTKREDLENVILVSDALLGRSVLEDDFASPPPIIER
jgi:hypothetical protein